MCTVYTRMRRAFANSSKNRTAPASRRYPRNTGNVAHWFLSDSEVAFEVLDPLVYFRLVRLLFLRCYTKSISDPPGFAPAVRLGFCIFSPRAPALLSRAGRRQAFSRRSRSPLLPPLPRPAPHPPRPPPRPAPPPPLPPRPHDFRKSGGLHEQVVQQIGAFLENYMRD